MKVRFLLLEEGPPALVRAVLGGLPAPFEAAEVAWTRLAGGLSSARPPDPHPDVGVSSCYDRQRSQYDAVRFLELVPEPEEGWLHLVLTGLDIFVPALTYVFGLSHLGGRRGVLSWARLKPAERGPESEALLATRLNIEVAHELGHVVGLVHCPVHDCAMHRSLWPENVDLKRPEYCPACLEGLRAAGA